MTGRHPATDLLYLRLDDAKNGPVLSHDPEAKVGADLTIRLSKREILSTDTFFGSFYKSYWLAYTKVRDLGVAVDIQGKAIVRVIEDTDAGIRVLCKETLSARWRNRYLLSLPDAMDDDNVFDQVRKGRIFVTIEAEGPVTVHGIDFVTDTAPVRKTRLSIGLCTFNQEKYFARTLSRVADLIRKSDAVAQVYVVNQGHSFESATIITLLDHPQVTCINQRNLGGCGGFTRSLDEAIKADDSTHHLMMDDDIVLDERMIARAIRFLDFANKDIALGAGMLDAMRPTVMYEAGAFLSTDNKISPYCTNVDMANSSNLHHFNSPVLTDYNAWWFCILPMDHANDLGLPAPVFIRGDDFEYGQRLARNGVPTVTLPGIAVWHEPFYAKPSGWQGYYDLRNRMIFGATYADKVNQLSLAHLTGLISSAILTHNYMMAELRLKAVTDFLAGPEVLFARDTETLHKQVMALARTHAPEKLEDASWKAQPVISGISPPLMGMRAMIVQFAMAMLRTGFGRLKIDERPVLMDSYVSPRNTAGRAYVLTNGPRSFHLGFTPNRARMWRMLWRTQAVMRQYWAKRGQVNQDWADHITIYHDANWWAGIYTHEDASQASKAE